MKNYIDKIEAMQLPVKNPTLRDCFDVYSSEFNDSKGEEKIITLKKITSSGISLHEIIDGYCKYYKELEKPYVANDVKFGLIYLINFLLKKNTSFVLDKFDDSYKMDTLILILNDLLINYPQFSIGTKNIFYKNLVDKRKKHSFSDVGLINPSEILEGILDGDYLNPFANWHNRLDAEILVIGQDFSSTNYFIENKGKDSVKCETNTNLSKLFKEGLKLDIGSTESPNKKAKLYFTNAVLGLKEGDMKAPVKKKWYLNTAFKFIKPLINIIEPKIIIVLGKAAYETICKIYSLQKMSLKEVVNNDPIILPDGKTLFVVYHCSNLGKVHRNNTKQLEDWRKMGEYLYKNGLLESVIE